MKKIIKDCTFTAKITKKQYHRIGSLSDSLGITKSAVIRILIDLEYEYLFINSKNMKEFKKSVTFLLDKNKTNL